MSQEKKQKITRVNRAKVERQRGTDSGERVREQKEQCGEKEKEEEDVNREEKV